MEINGVQIDTSMCLKQIEILLFGKKSETNRKKVRALIAENGGNPDDYSKPHNKKPTRYCLHCGRPLKAYQNKYCSRSCSISESNLLRKQSKFCLNCGSPITNSGNKFCSLDCAAEYRHNKYINRWKQGKEDGLRGEYGISGHIRRYLLEKYNYSCQLCGWGEINLFTGNIPLEVHHIDGDYTNNSEENLQLLCPNCHSLTSTFKSHNSNGRIGRSKYYNGGE